MVALYAWFFFEVRLYAQVLLNGVFAAMQLYGWWQWTRGSGGEGGRPVVGATVMEVGIGLLLAALGSVGLGADDAHRGGLPLAGCGTDGLQPAGATVDGAQAVAVLGVVDRRGCALRGLLHLSGLLAHRRVVRVVHRAGGDGPAGMAAGEGGAIAL